MPRPFIALLFATDYHPLVRVRIVSRFPTPTATAILGRVTPSGHLLDDSTHRGYLIDLGFGSTPTYGLLFARRYLPPGHQYVLGTDASYVGGAPGMVEAPILPRAVDRDGQENEGSTSRS